MRFRAFGSFAKALKAVQLCFGSMLLTGDFI